MKIIKYVKNLVQSKFFKIFLRLLINLLISEIYSPLLELIKFIIEVINNFFM